MESKHFIDCIKNASEHFRRLNKAQDECKISVDAGIDLLATECGRPITPAEKNNIKKFAKALATQKTDSLKNEAENMAMLIEAFFPGEFPLMPQGVDKYFPECDEVEMSCGKHTVTLTNK